MEVAHRMSLMQIKSPYHADTQLEFTLYPPQTDGASQGNPLGSPAFQIALRGISFSAS